MHFFLLEMHSDTRWIPMKINKWHRVVNNKSNKWFSSILPTLSFSIYLFCLRISYVERTKGTFSRVLLCQMLMLCVKQHIEFIGMQTGKGTRKWKMTIKKRQHLISMANTKFICQCDKFKLNAESNQAKTKRILKPAANPFLPSTKCNKIINIANNDVCKTNETNKKSSRQKKWRNSRANAVKCAMHRPN